MGWDDELESLANAVTEMFGKQALEAAAARALTVATRNSSWPAEPGSLVRSVVGGRARVLPPGAFENCLRDELRRLLRPH